KIPGMRMLYRSAIRSATGVVVYSKELETLVRENYARRGPLITITSGVEKDLFRPLDKLECRRQLNLPTQRKLIGAAGTLSEIKNTQVLIEAFQALAKTRDDIILVLAGALGSDFSIPKDPRIIYLGELAHEEIALFLNSLDLAVICYKESPCGQTAYPTRIMEAIACQVPFVCADVGSFRTILENDPRYLFSSNDKIDLMRAIEAQISDPSRFEMDQKSWHEYIKELEAFILACCDANHARAA
ncbi:MAG: glycosyltransferase, partial [Bdellovibrionales bacterium]|nr:glycosyltransferase [Bdellovibrionales bacterium]